MKKANGITLNNEDYEIIPPAPSDEGRGGITKEEYDKYNGYAAEIEQVKTGMVSKVDTTSIPSLTQEEYDALTEKTALYYYINEW